MQGVGYQISTLKRRSTLGKDGDRRIVAWDEVAMMVYLAVARCNEAQADKKACFELEKQLERRRQLWADVDQITTVAEPRSDTQRDIRHPIEYLYSWHLDSANSLTTWFMT